MITASNCSIAVDDLGAGFSALSILADLQPAYIKLDMSLVRNIHREPRKQRLVSLLRSFGDATDAAVIAEGVESEGETRALLDCGVRLLQGYHLARPSERFVDLRGPTAGVARRSDLGGPAHPARESLSDPERRVCSQVPFDPAEQRIRFERLIDGGGGGVLLCEPLRAHRGPLRPAGKKPGDLGPGGRGNRLRAARSPNK